VGNEDMSIFVNVCWSTGVAIPLKFISQLLGVWDLCRTKWH